MIWQENLHLNTSPSSSSFRHYWSADVGGKSDNRKSFSHRGEKPTFVRSLRCSSNRTNTYSQHVHMLLLYWPSTSNCFLSSPNSSSSSSNGTRRVTTRRLSCLLSWTRWERREERNKTFFFFSSLFANNTFSMFQCVLLIDAHNAFDGKAIVKKRERSENRLRNCYFTR